MLPMLILLPNQGADTDSTVLEVSEEKGCVKVMWDNGECNLYRYNSRRLDVQVLLGENTAVLVVVVSQGSRLARRGTQIKSNQRKKIAMSNKIMMRIKEEGGSDSGSGAEELDSNDDVIESNSGSGCAESEADDSSESMCADAVYSGHSGGAVSSSAVYNPMAKVMLAFLMSRHPVCGAASAARVLPDLAHCSLRTITCYTVIVMVRSEQWAKLKVKSTAQREKKWKRHLIKLRVCPLTLSIVGDVEVVEMPVVHKGGVRFPNMFQYCLGNINTGGELVKFLGVSGKMKRVQMQNRFMFCSLILSLGRTALVVPQVFILCDTKYAMWKTSVNGGIVVVPLPVKMPLCCIIFTDVEVAVLLWADHTDTGSTVVQFDFADVRQTYSLQQYSVSLSARHSIPWGKAVIERALLLRKSDSERLVVFHTKNTGSVYIASATSCQEVVHSAIKLISPVSGLLLPDRFLLIHIGFDYEAQLWGCDITAQQQLDPLCFGKMSLRPSKGAITTCVVKAAHSTESTELFNKQNDEDVEEVRNQVTSSGGVENNGIVALVRCEAAKTLVLSEGWLQRAREREREQEQVHEQQRRGGKLGITRQRERVRFVEPLSGTAIACIELAEGTTVGDWFCFPSS
ncbi:hypothetical protein Pelo_13304 [Pelomyxa schiedti]|nr:hypothetical protein Pelo_13304 [Pelomyxa schiedti]